MKYLFKHFRPIIGVGLILISGIIFGKTFDPGTLAGTVLGAVGIYLLFGCGE